MSLQTWKEEFYPKAANQVSADEALDHSIKKWTGLYKKNLKKHNLSITEYGDVYSSDDIFLIGIDSCALCRYYGVYSCKGCDIVEMTKKKCYDTVKIHGDSPWDLWMDKHQAHPMVNLLKKVKQLKKGNISI